MHDARPIILIVGPTAGGKTEVAVHLAQRLPGGGECVCADSMQVYRGMDAGTAKPTAAQRAAVPHHLLDVADAADDGFTVDTWLELAERAIDGIRSRGRWPVVVGGTNLYVQALVAGLLDGPEPDPALRRELEALDLDALRRRLERVDPEASARIHRNDRKRSIRAIEVFEQTGRRLSDLQEQWASEPRPDIFVVGLEWPTESINRRINARVRRMMAAGLLEETAALLDSGRLGRQAREALGYRQLIDHLEGRCTLGDAVEQIGIRTRRYAKQQRTWLRRFRLLRPSVWIDADRYDVQDIANQALASIIACWHPASAIPGEPPGDRGV